MEGNENVNLLFKSIESGDVNYFKNSSFNPSSLNQIFFKTNFYKVKTPSKKCCFTQINNITPIVACILSEQDKLLKYLINNFHPDLSIKCDGWAPIHFSCCTGSYKCLKVLLKQQYIQENIDAFIDYHFAADNGNGTTALHVAATNKCHAQALLLTTELPKIDSEASYQSANPTQKSAFGNTPLHIAAFNNDWDMCQILLNANDDCTIVNDDGLTPLQIAKNNGYTDLYNNFHNELAKPIEELQKEYFEIDLVKLILRQTSDIKLDKYEDEINNLTAQIQMLNAKLTILSK